MNKILSLYMWSRPFLCKQDSISSNIKSNIYGFHGYYITILVPFSKQTNIIVMSLLFFSMYGEMGAITVYLFVIE